MSEHDDYWQAVDAARAEILRLHRVEYEELITHYRAEQDRRDDHGEQ